ncbi:DUF3883 domain-containing protein [Caloranaerobacter sp. DY30410]|uniref:DUF3883 domain-containing protein n=1 Tax=Caloranaerobacter sp. DY30410 TaxID=3238305 RepID=UPI003D08E82A
MRKMIFLNIGWMKNYKGIFQDEIKGGGAFVEKHGYGHEIFNFLPFKGYVYGYVQAKDSININRLGALDNDECIEDVLVIWVSKHPSGGTYIVGWYNNATVYRWWQSPPKNSNRVYNDEEFGYFVKAKEEDAVLLSIDERVFKIPRGKGGMGQSNVWYADKDEHQHLRKEVLNYISNRQIYKRNEDMHQNKELTYQPDPYKRQKVEKIAVEHTVSYYKRLGYTVDSVERDNVGWDLEARMDNRFLRIEVKGLSGSAISFELTPNEYANMNKYKESYRIAVVTNCLTEKPELRIFQYSCESGKFEDSNGRQLKVKKIISARMTL